MFRTLLRYFGLMCLTAPFIASGLQKLLSPSIDATALAQGSLPKFLATFGIVLGTKEYIIITEAIGGLFLSLSLFILLGIGRYAVAFILACMSLILTTALYVDYDNPLKLTERNIGPLTRNIAIAGGLLFVSGSGHRSKRFEEATLAAREQRDKKTKEWGL